MNSTIFPEALLTAAVCTCALSPSVEAQVIFDTLSSDYDAQINVVPGVNFLSQPNFFAQSFTTDATTASIAAVTVKFSAASSDGNYVLSLRSNGSNFPSTEIATIGTGLNADIFGGGAGVFTPTFFNVSFSSLSIPVSPNTRYWIYATTTGTGGARWASHLGNLVANESIAQPAAAPSTARTQIMSVTVTPIPEPATEAAVAAGALLVLGACRWARRWSC